LDKSIQILRYATPSGRKPVSEWFAAQRDNKVASAVEVRIDRVRIGLFGDHRYIGQGLWELRIHFGAGYRVYFLRDGARVVILLCVGDKRSQRRDIHKAQQHAADYWRNKQ
jgi:putative addiction module killer protein